MNRTLTFVILALAAACGPGTGQSRDGSDGSAADPLQQLEAETGHAWTVRWRDDLHTPALLEGRTAPMATTGSDAARAGRDFLRRHGALFSMGVDDELVADDSSTDELGMTHARFQQHLGTIPVWGGELLAHFDSDGSLVRVNGRYVPIGAPAPMVVQSADQARVLAVADARASHPAVSSDAFTTAAPKLYLYPITTASAKLAWRVEIDVADDNQTMVLESFVDAVDGSIVHAAEVTAYVDGSGLGVLGDRQPLVVAANGASYILEDATRGSPATRTYSAGGSTRLPGTAVRSKDPTSWDTAGLAPGAAVDAHAFVAAAWDYFAKVHGRHGWDGKNKGVHATVHYGKRYDNAFFDGKQLVFGDGDGGDFSAPAGGARCRRTRVHPRRHVSHGAPRYGGRNRCAQRGAVGHFRLLRRGQLEDRRGHLPSLGPRQRAARRRRSACVGQSRQDVRIRRHYRRQRRCPCQQHNRIARSVPHDRRKLPSATVEKIWYRALAHYLHSKANFVDAADATLSAARDLGGNAETAVQEAWVTVGVIE